MNGFELVIDEGHGANDTGATWEGLVERDLNRLVGSELTTSLYGMCRVTRTCRGDEDPSFSERARRSSRGSFLVSIHHNAVSDPSVSGVEVYIMPDASLVERLVARRIIEASISELRSRTSRVVEAWDDPQIVGDEWKQRPCNVLCRHKCKKVLVEACYLSNEFDRSIVRTLWGRMAIVSAIRSGVAYAIRGHHGDL